MCASASGNSATSCDRTATINTAAIVAPTTAILIVRITISSAIITAATGYNRSPADDRSTTIGDTTSSYSTTMDGTASSCATSVGSAAAAAPAPDQYNLSVILSVVRQSNFEEIFWKDRNRRAHCRQDKQDRARKPRKDRLERQIAR
jgi:hypothetical protein